MGCTIQGDVVVFDVATGERTLILDGPTVTAYRTAAVSLPAAQLLAPNKQGPLLIVGAGVQGRAHLDAFADGLPLEEVRIASRSIASAQELASRCRRPCVLEGAGRRVPGLGSRPRALQELRLGGVGPGGGAAGCESISIAAFALMAHRKDGHRIQHFVVGVQSQVSGAPPRDDEFSHVEPNGAPNTRMSSENFKAVEHDVRCLRGFVRNAFEKNLSEPLDVRSRSVRNDQPRHLGFLSKFRSGFMRGFVTFSPRNFARM